MNLSVKCSDFIKTRMGTIFWGKFPFTFSKPESYTKCQTTVIKAGWFIRFLQPFFIALSFPVMPVKASRSSRSFSVSEEMPSRTKFHLGRLLMYLFLQTDNRRKTTLYPKIISFSVDNKETKASYCFLPFWINILVNVLAISNLMMNLTYHVSVRTSASSESESEDSDDWVRSTLKHFFPFPFIQSGFLSLIWWYKFNTFRF